MSLRLFIGIIKYYIMADKLKYPTGTKVIYNPPYSLHYSDEKYRNKTGIIVSGGECIFPRCRFPDGKQVATAWGSLTQALVKNQQLLFNFMKE